MPSIGQGEANPLPLHGSLWLDARAFGLSVSSSDIGPAAQATLDAAKVAILADTSSFGSGIAPRAVVFIPGASKPYTCKTSSFVEASGIEVKGEGEGTQINTPSGVGLPIFYCGVYRNDAGPQQPGTTYRPDLWNSGTPKLDSTVVTAANQKWGFRSSPFTDPVTGFVSTGFIYSQASCFSHGRPSPTVTIPDNWRETPQFTVDLACEGFSSGQMPASSYVCGVGFDGNNTIGSQQGVWVLRTSSANTYQLTLYTQTVRFGPVSKNVFTFSTGTATGVQRISVGVDCTNAVITAYGPFNGGSNVQLTVTHTSGTFTAGCFPSENQYFPFTVNAQGNGQSGGGNTDWALYGLAISCSLRYANVSGAQIANPQFSIINLIGGTGKLVVPGPPAGGTYNITYKGTTVTGVPYNANSATLQTALQNAGINVTVTASQVTSTPVGYQYQLTNAAGFTLDPTQASCDGTLLTGQVINDRYRYYPAPGAYTATLDDWALGYFGFTENPTATPAPRNLAINTGGIVQLVYQCPSVILTARLQTLIGDNKFTDLVLDTSGPYGVPLVLGESYSCHMEGCSFLGGIYAVAHMPIGQTTATWYHRLYNCTLQANDAGYFADSAQVTLRDIFLTSSCRYAFRFCGCVVNVNGVRVNNYGHDPCGFTATYTNDYGNGGSFSDVKLDLEGGSVANALFYMERVSDDNNICLVRDIYGGSIGQAPIFKLVSNNGANSPIAYLDIDTIDCGNTGGIVNVDGGNWIGEVRNCVTNYGPYVSNNPSVGRPRVKILEIRSMTFPRWQNWFSGTIKQIPPGPVDGQFQELYVAKDGTHGSLTPPTWKGLHAIQVDPNASLAAYAIDHTAISATLSGQATSWGRVTANTAGRGGAAMLFGQPNSIFGSTFLGSSSQLVIGATGGTFTLSYGGQTTGTIAFNAPAAGIGSVQTALQALSSIAGNNMIVGGANGGPYTISPINTLVTAAGATNGLTVNGSGLTGGPTVVVVSSNQGNTKSFTFQGVTGGTFTLTAGSNTTAALAWNANGPTIQAAMLAASISPAPNRTVANMVPSAIPGAYYSINVSGLTMNTTSLTGVPYAAVQVDPANPYSVPQTYYAALQTANAAGFDGSGTEPMSGTTGYNRVAVTNNTTNFGASSAGSKTSGAAITWPTLTAPITVNAITFMSSPSATSGLLTLQLASPITFTAGQTPTISSGGLTIVHTPYASTSSFAGGMTDQAWGKVHDLLFGGVPFTVPATWYVALSSAAPTRSSTLTGEPSGNGYARVSVSNVVANWLASGFNNENLGQFGDAKNAAAIAFGSPTGSWSGPLIKASLMDASSSGLSWFEGSLPNPVSPTTSGAAPTFQAGAFVAAAS
jgi:hypothetical protein